MRGFIKTTLILSGLLLFGAGCARYQTPKSESTTPEVSAPVSGVTEQEAVIEYRDGMFDPSTLRILAGTKVTFVNKGTREVWPASGRHPAHDICPGFDALKGLKTGETYTFKFTEAKDCPFHNHLKASEYGKVEVKGE